MLNGFFGVLQSVLFKPMGKKEKTKNEKITYKSYVSCDGGITDVISCSLQ